MTTHTCPDSWHDLGTANGVAHHASSKFWTRNLFQVLLHKDIVAAASVHAIAKFSKTTKGFLSRNSANRLALLGVQPSGILSASGKGSPYRPSRPTLPLVPSALRPQRAVGGARPRARTCKFAALPPRADPGLPATPACVDRGRSGASPATAPMSRDPSFRWQPARPRRAGARLPPRGRRPRSPRAVDSGAPEGLRVA